jgi:hypothetical protein
VPPHQRLEGRFIPAGKESFEELAIGGLFEGSPQLAQDAAESPGCHLIRSKAWKRDVTNVVAGGATNDDFFGG